jgi:hypothetical protein
MRAGVAAALCVLLTAQAVSAQTPSAPAAPAPSAAPAASAAPATSTAPAPPPHIEEPRDPRNPKIRPAIEDAKGTPVTFTSTDVTMRVYLARGDLRETPILDPYEKLPPLPTTVRLAPGTYTAEAESPNASTGHQRFVVEHDAPITVDVHSGNASVKAFGGVFIGLGIVAAILGIVSIVSISPNDSSYPRWAIGLPLTLGGLGLGGLGIGMTFLGSTEIVAPHAPPGGAVRRTTTGSLALSWKF